ncbi:MAG TPA: hemerythrin domain-containing protein, partial [Terriglobales bacterium]
MNKATEALEREHELIQKVVAIMAQLVSQLELRHAVSSEVLRDLLQFMREFSEQCHHGKEESYFFPYLESKGVPSTGCPLAALKGEHAKSRQLLDDLNSAAAIYIGNPENGRLALTDVLQSLVTLYPAHMWKEDYLLFPMADKVLGEADHESLLRQFEMAEQVLGSNAHERFSRLADELSERIAHCPQCEQI